MWVKVIGPHIVIGDLDNRLSETLCDEFDLLDHPPLDDVVFAAQTKRLGLAVQCFLADIIIDQPLQLLA